MHDIYIIFRQPQSIQRCQKLQMPEGTLRAKNGHPLIKFRRAINALIALYLPLPCQSNFAVRAHIKFLGRIIPKRKSHTSQIIGNQPCNPCCNPHNAYAPGIACHCFQLGGPRYIGQHIHIQPFFLKPPLIQRHINPKGMKRRLCT